MSKKQQKLYDYRYRQTVYEVWNITQSRHVAQEKSKAGYVVERSRPLRYQWRVCFEAIKGIKKPTSENDPTVP